MFRSNKKIHKPFANRPDFVVIGNLYDDLFQLSEKYGFQQLIMHLGEVAKNTSRGMLAGKIWAVLHLENKPTTQGE